MIGSLIKCQRGNSLVEMALAAPLMAALLMGMVDVSRGVSAKLGAVQVAQRTIERVQRSGFKTSDIAGLEAEAEAAAGTGSDAVVTAWLECGSSTTQLAFTATCASGQAYARFVRISVTQSFTPVFGTAFLPGANADGTLTFEGTAGVRVQ